MLSEMTRKAKIKEAKNDITNVTATLDRLCNRAMRPEEYQEAKQLLHLLNIEINKIWSNTDEY